MSRKRSLLEDDTDAHERKRHKPDSQNNPVFYSVLTDSLYPFMPGVLVRLILSFCNELRRHRQCLTSAFWPLCHSATSSTRLFGQFAHRNTGGRVAKLLTWMEYGRGFADGDTASCSLCVP